jgi:hypothetical protein
MISADFIEPKEIETEGHKFIISKVPCTVALRIFEKMQQCEAPILKLKFYDELEKLRYELLSYTAIVSADPNIKPSVLLNEGLVRAHIKTHPILTGLINEMREYNEGFLTRGSLQTSLDSIMEKLPDMLTKILTGSWEQLLANVTQLSGNLKQSIL